MSRLPFLAIGTKNMLKLTLTIGHIRLQSEKFQCDGILDNVSRLLYHLPLLCQAHYFVLVTAQRQTFVKAATYLTAQMAF